jgi:hypothetical protein
VKRDIKVTAMMTTMRIYSTVQFLLLMMMLFAPREMVAQDQDEVKSKLKVFLDCRARCDFNYIRSEINIVDYLINKDDADVHILINNQITGNGGGKTELIFYGQNKFSSMLDTLSYSFPPNQAASQTRDLMLQFLKLGLAPYLAKSTMAMQVDMVTKVEEDELVDFKNLSQTPADPWNYWTQIVGVNGNLRLDQLYQTLRTSGYFQSTKITKDLKIRFRVGGGREVSTYKYETDSGMVKTVVDNSDFNARHFIARGINNNWTYGYETSFTNSTFSNLKGSLYFSTGLERSLFPYSRVNNKFIALRYGLDVRDNHYYDSTIFNKKNELLFGQKMILSLKYNQRWGYVEGGMRYRNYFHDWALYNLSVNSSVNIRLTGALSFNVDLYGALVHDQVNLAQGEASKDDVLTRKRQMASAYNFATWFGVNYRFGTSVNNFVNPRFEGVD